MQFRITETVDYIVEADSVDEAKAIFLAAPNVNDYFVEVCDREISDDRGLFLGCF